MLIHGLFSEMLLSKHCYLIQRCMGAFFQIYTSVHCMYNTEKKRLDITDALFLIPSSTLNVRLLPKRLYDVGLL